MKTIYHVFLDRFSISQEVFQLKYDGDWDKAQSTESLPDYVGGHIRGVIERFEYIKDLGVDTLWLSPFQKNSEYHGYWTTDYYDVDENFGTIEDVKALAKLCHSNGLELMMDFVPNHVGHLHPFFLDAKNKEDSKYHNWFIWEQWPDEYETFLDVKELPKLNTVNGAVQEHLIGAALFWMDHGVDHLRIDHAIGVSMDFLRKLRLRVKEKRQQTMLIGEVWFSKFPKRLLFQLGLPNAERINFAERWLGFDANYWAMRQYLDVLDGCLDFVAHRLIKRHFQQSSWLRWEWLLRFRLSLHYKSFPRNWILIPFLDNHDMNRFAYSVGQNIEILKSAAKFLLSKILYQPVCLYYGTEIAMTHIKGMESLPQYSDLVARRLFPWNEVDTETNTQLRSYFKELIARRSEHLAKLARPFL